MGREGDDRGAAPSSEFEPMNTQAIETGIRRHEMTADDLVKALLRKFRESGPPPAPINPKDIHKTFLGWTWAEWLKTTVLGAIAVGSLVLTIIGWKNSVDDGLKARPTKEEMQQSVQTSIQFHMLTPGQHQGLEAKVTDTRESQIRTEEQIKAINASLQQIKITVRR